MHASGDVEARGLLLPRGLGPSVPFRGSAPLELEVLGGLARAEVVLIRARARVRIRARVRDRVRARASVRVKTS